MQRKGHIFPIQEFDLISYSQRLTLIQKSFADWKKSVFELWMSDATILEHTVENSKNRPCKRPILE